MLLAGGFMLAPMTFAQPALGQGQITPLITEAAAYESGQNMASLRRIEALVFQSAANPALRKEIEAGLVKLLAANATFEARRFACQQLAIVGSEDSLPALSDLLKNQQTVAIACLALTTHPSAKASEILRNALSALRGMPRVQVINTLGDRQDPEAAKPLSGLCRDSDPAVAEAAIASLGKIANEPARQTIAALRKEGNRALARAVIEASLQAAEKLSAAGDRPAAAAIYEELLQPSQPAYARRGALGGLLLLDADQGEGRILSLLRGSDTTLKPVAIAAITSLRSKDASERFARELPKLQPQEQVWMIESLASRGDAGARSAITANLTAPAAAVRLAAITAAGSLGNASSVPLLSKALANATSPEERQAAEAALGILGGGEPTDLAIIDELKRAAAETKSPLISVLAKRRNRVAVPALLNETGNPNPAVVKAAFQALGKLAAAEDLSVLLDKLVSLKVSDVRSEAESAVVQAILKVPDASRRSEAVCGMLDQAADAEVRCSLLRLLPSCGDAKALAALKAASASAEPRLRDTAIRALAEWPDSAAWDILAGIYRQPENDSHRALALRALVRLVGEENAHPDARLRDHYRQLLAGARSDEDRKLILSALAGVAHPEALQLALPLLSNSGVRAEAELAIKKIAESIKAQHPQAAQDALQRLKEKTP